MTKDELLERLDNWNYQSSSLALIKKLIKGTDETDPNFKAALDDDMAEQIVSYLIECYDVSSLLEWLAADDFDVFSNYRSAEVVRRSNFKDEEDFKENSGAFYNGEPDCPIYNEDKGVYVIRW